MNKSHNILKQVV